MVSFSLISVTYVLWFTVALVASTSQESQDESIREIQSAIVQELNKNRHLNAIQQNEEVQTLLETLEPETRESYKLWISELQELEKERTKKLKVSETLLLRFDFFAVSSINLYS